MENIFIINFILLWLVLIFNLLLTISLIRKFNLMQSNHVNGLETGIPAPGFSAQGINGETVRSEFFKGKRLAIVFISPLCSPCRDMLPKIEKLYSVAREKNIEIVGMSAGNLEDTKEMVVEMGISMLVFAAPPEKNPVFKDFKVRGTPSFCLINEDGLVESSGYPSLEEGIWKELSRSSEMTQPPLEGASITGGA